MEIYKFEDGIVFDGLEEVPGSAPWMMRFRNLRTGMTMGVNLEDFDDKSWDFSCKLLRQGKVTPLEMAIELSRKEIENGKSGEKEVKGRRGS